MINNFLTCLPDCNNNVQLPAIPVSQDCADYDQLNSQVSDVIIVPYTAPDAFTWSAGVPTLVPANVDNSSAGNSLAKRLVGEGSVSVPEKGEEVLPRNVRMITRRLYTLSFRVKNLSSTMYEFLRLLQCGWKGFRIYYLTIGGVMFGQEGGIRVSFVDVDFPLGGGRNDLQYADLTIQFEALHDPYRSAVTITDADFEPEAAEGASEVIGDPEGGEAIGDGGDAVGP